MEDPTYIFKDSEVYAVREGKVVASASSVEELEKLAFGEDGPDYGYGEQGSSGGPTRMPRDPDDPSPGPGQYICPNCQTDTHDWGSGSCAHCGERLTDNDPEPYDLHADDDHGPMDSDPYDVDQGPDHHSPWNMQASVIGPGGIKGKILAKTRDIWGDEVSVRFENGRIAHLRVVHDGTLQGGFKESTEKVSSTTSSPADQLLARLEADFDAGRAGIVARIADLEDICSEGRHLIATRQASQNVASLDGIIVTAEAERGTLREALEAIDADAATQAEFAPYEIKAAHSQASIGRGDGGWLDGVVSGMIAEAEGQDFNKIIREGSLLFVSDLDDGAIADTGVTRDMATRHIRSKTAGIDSEAAAGIERDFLAQVEAARRTEVTSRAHGVQKEASTTVDRYADLPDDILFS